MTEATEMPRVQAQAAAVQGTWAAALAPTASAPLLMILLVVLALRCWVAGRMDLEVDEPYYWLWSRHLAASYYDHPPMIAYWVRLGTWIFGDTLIGVRSMAALAMLLASGLLYALALILFGERRIGLLAVLWFNMTPHATIFSVIMSIDTPALLFWLLSCVGLALIWRSGRGEWWYLVGAATGCLLLSKYTGAFLVVGVVLWLLASDEMRHWLKRREPYIGGLIALIIFSPVIQWNAQHGWASFIKQFGRALNTSPQGGLLNVGMFVGGQAAFASPLIFAFAVAGIAVAGLRGLRRQQANWLLLVLTSAPVLLYFFIHAFSAEVLTQWPSAAYPTAILAGVAAFAMRSDEAARHPVIRYSFDAAPWLGFVITTMMCLQMMIAPVPVSAARDPFSRFSGYAELAAETGAVAEAQQALFIATNNYGTDAMLAFYLRNIPVFQTSEAIRYISLPPIDQTLLTRANGIYVAGPDPGDDLPALREHFDTVEFISTIWRTRNGDPIEPYRIYRLQGYHGGLPF